MPNYSFPLNRSTGPENMPHRAIEIGAMLSVESTPGGGTRILLEKVP